MTRIRRDAFRAVAARCGYGDWQGANRLEEELLVWNLVLAPILPPDWYSEDVEVVHAAGWPRAIQSVARDERGRAALVDVFECASRADAHVLLVTILAQAQSPLIRRDDDPALGDVVFRGPGDGLVLSARANVVTLLRTADRTPPDVYGAAVRLDAELVAKPPVEPVTEADAERAPRPAIRRLAAAAPAVRRGRAVALELAAESPAAEPLSYKAFSRTGELSRRDDRVMYRQTSRGEARVELYAVAADGAAAAGELRLPSA